MFYREYPPPAELKQSIQCFWILEHDYREKFHTHEHLWADTHTELIFSYGQPYYQKIKPGRRVSLPASFVIGPFKKELLLYSDGFTGFVAVRFQPWGLAGFSGSKMSGLINKVGSAVSVMGKGAAVLEKQLAGKTKEEKLAIVAGYFVSEWKKNKKKEGSIQAIAEDIKRKKGVVKIADLANEYKINPRKLERCFISETGMTAKMFSRILRFNYAKALIERDPGISLASLTYETGYSDQAHFSKNFREMFNYSPAEFKSLIRKFNSDANGSDLDVVFLQDNE